MTTTQRLLTMELIVYSFKVYHDFQLSDTHALVITWQLISSLGQIKGNFKRNLVHLK